MIQLIIIINRYDARWYYGSSKTQSLYLLVLRKCLNPPKLTGGGLIALNLDSFIKVSLFLQNIRNLSLRKRLTIE